MENKNIPIFPIFQNYYNSSSNIMQDWVFDSKQELDYKAIVTFCFFGFMLDDETFYKKIKVIKPSTKVTFENSKIIKKVPYWEWNYNPIERPFETVLEEFSDIFEFFIYKKINDKKILLPISGGLDSRTILASISNNENLTLGSYEFEGGISEIKYGLEMAREFSIPIYTEKISNGYLWNKIDKLVKLNNCFTEFTHPRQLAILENWKNLGNIVLLGHMGDILFDSHSDKKQYSKDEELSKLLDKLVKPGAYELANDLWNYWGLSGTFNSYILEKMDSLFSSIKIENLSAKIRAFKMNYYGTRWSAVNIALFKQLGELVLPFCDDKMCKFVSTVPENYLYGRKIQIEYIKKQCPEIAQIAWQSYAPLNLYNYKLHNSPPYYLFRIIGKLYNSFKSKFINPNMNICRNWELQFLGKKNLINLEGILSANKEHDQLISSDIYLEYLKKFQLNSYNYAHPISMLLTLKMFTQNHYKQ